MFNTSLRLKSIPLYRGCWWWHHSQAKLRHLACGLGDTVSLSLSPSESLNTLLDKLQQEGTLPWPSLTVLWDVASLILRPQWGLHLQRPQSCKSHGGARAGHRKTVKMGKTEGCEFLKQHKGFCSTCRSATAEQAASTLALVRTNTQLWCVKSQLRLHLMSAKTGKASSSDEKQTNLLQGREAPAYAYGLVTWKVCVCWGQGFRMPQKHCL